MGVALPYRFSRSAAILEPNCLELRYRLTNTGETACPYLWTAHPQFVADSQTRIILPPEVIQMVNVIEGDPNWGKAGERHRWPAAIAANGETRRLDRVYPPETHSCRKFYVPPEQPAAWVALAQDELGCQLRMEWMPAEVPYLGLWVDEGTYNTAPVAAPEPSNGYYDSLERAVRNQKVMVLEPGESREWTLLLRFGAGI
jgi:galactose mutarotase-like enzyme